MHKAMQTFKYRDICEPVPHVAGICTLRSAGYTTGNSKMTSSRRIRLDSSLVATARSPLLTITSHFHLLRAPNTPLEPSATLVSSILTLHQHAFTVPSRRGSIWDSQMATPIPGREASCGASLRFCCKLGGHVTRSWIFMWRVKDSLRRSRVRCMEVLSGPFLLDRPWEGTFERYQHEVWYHRSFLHVRDVLALQRKIEWPK
jgi:hypothetical protein